MNCRLCQSCWTYWKKYGGLKVASRLADSESEMIKKKIPAITGGTGSTGSTGSTVATSGSVASLAVVTGAGVAGVGGGGGGGGGIAGGGGSGGGIVSGSGGVVGAPAVANTVNDLEVGNDTNSNSNDLSNRSPHKCSIANCDKEFKVKAHLARHYAQAHGIAIRSGSPRPIMKTRTAFYLQTTGATKLSRRLCRQIIRSKKAARQPSYAINLQAVKQECKLTLSITILEQKMNSQTQYYNGNIFSRCNCNRWQNTNRYSSIAYLPKEKSRQCHPYCRSSR